MAHRSRNRIIVVAVFLGVIAVGAWVGTRAGDLAFRAPRGSGTRIAVLGPLSSNGGLGVDAMVQDAVARDLTSLPDVTVLPPLEVRSKRLQMVRGGIDNATDQEAAKVLDADLVLAVRANDLVDVDGVDHDVVLAHFDTIAQLPEVLAAARKRVGVSAPTLPPVTMNAEAYAFFLEGERLAQVVGSFREAAVVLEKAVAADETMAEAWTALAWSSFFADDRTPQETTRTKEAIGKARMQMVRSSVYSSLLVDALGGWLAHDDAAPELRAALREPAIAGARALTVKLPEERNGHLLLGRAYRELFDGASEGLRHLEAGRRLAPDYFPIAQQITIAWLDVGDRKHAEQALRAFLLTSPGHPEATRILEGLTRGTPVERNIGDP